MGKAPAKQLPAMPGCYSTNRRAGQTVTMPLGFCSSRSTQMANVIASSYMHFLFPFPNFRSTHIFK